ncbi:DNA polymerase IV [Inediibacterium massiliense]|uniref:DNA polymerase IV n=1 Tax=Inediibacterium massiliense TaxID=1658111 RepID=UPI0006B64A84|nr:DNA polymerase IV [Inediibacterium massiliense]
MERDIIHIDMDAFYASIEQRDHKDYRNKPIAVGGDPKERGVVCTASYEARKYGVRSAMPSKQAKKLCPHLIFVPVKMEKYLEVSQNIHNILEEYTEFIEPISIDEAFLDVTGGDPIFIGQEIKKRIQDEIGITASVGISINKYLAKLASDYEKPNGFTIIKKDEIEKFLGPLPIRKLWGVGPKTEKELHKLGLYHIEDILRYNPQILKKKFGKKGLELFQYAKGKDDRSVENKNRTKSIGEESTLKKDTRDLKILKEFIKNHCKQIEDRLNNKKLTVRTITLKIKYEDFTSITRSQTLPHYTNTYEELYQVSEMMLVKKISFEKKIRLIGVQVSNILYPNDPIQMKIEDIF